MKAVNSKSIREQAGIEIRPESDFVLSCVRSQIDPSAKQHILDLVRGGLNWPEVTADAIHHSVATLLYETVMSLAPDLTIPAAQQHMLHEAARAPAMNALVLFAELLRIYPLFEAARIPVIPYKGPVLAWLAYGSIARRVYEDLDFAVPQKHIPDAVAVLKAAEYRAQFDSREAHAGQGATAPGQYLFNLIGPGTRVELHTERTLRYFPTPLEFQDLTGRLIRVDIPGLSVRTFSIEDTLVMLCVHGAKHFWERILWVLDVAKLITVQPVNWNLLLAIAEKMKSTRVLLLGLYLAHDLLGAPLPEFILQKIHGDGTVRKMAETVYGQYRGISDPSAGVWPRAVFRVRSRDAFGQGLRHLMRLAMSPTESDRSVVHLPGFLSPLYMLVRPWRLAREYGLGLKRKLKPDLAIYEPTPPDIVSQMLRLAEVSPGDVLYDLGCGDGRIVVTAAQKYGIHAVGVDINPKRISEARASARKHGVDHLVQFHQGDAKKFDVSKATIVTMYLGADANLRLVERLRSELRPGARIVSRDFGIDGWPPDSSEMHELPAGLRTRIFLWTIRKGEGETQNAANGAAELKQSGKTEG
jgi:SAM-dependent methyltransferase